MTSIPHTYAQKIQNIVISHTVRMFLENFIIAHANGLPAERETLLVRIRKADEGQKVEVMRVFDEFVKEFVK